MANPTWPSTQVCSITLPSTRVRIEFLSSTMVFSVQTFFHVTGRVMWLPRIVMSEGTRFGTDGSAPPNITDCAAPSRKLFWIRNGPAPFHPPIACESLPLEWHSESHESMTNESDELSATQRDSWSVGNPCT